MTDLGRARAALIALASAIDEAFDLGLHECTGAPDCVCIWLNVRKRYALKAIGAPVRPPYHCYCPDDAPEPVCDYCTGSPPAGDALAMPGHCWKDGPWICAEHDDCWCDSGVSTTCMLEAGHAGPHVWTRDDKIGVSFGPERATKETR